MTFPRNYRREIIAVDRTTALGWDRAMATTCAGAVIVVVLLAAMVAGVMFL